MEPVRTTKNVILFDRAKKKPCPRIHIPRHGFECYFRTSTYSFYQQNPYFVRPAFCMISPSLSNLSAINEPIFVNTFMVITPYF